MTHLPSVLFSKLAIHRSKSIARRTFSLLIDQVLLRESSLRGETGNQLLNAAGDEGPGDIKIVADRGALIPTLFRFGRREPPTGVAGERHDQAGVGEALGRDQSAVVLPTSMPWLFKPAT